MDNPFQSPETASPALVDDGGVRRPHLLLRLFYGWFFGGLFGAVFSAVGASCLSWIIWQLFEISNDNGDILIDGMHATHWLPPLSVAAMMGLFSGGVCGSFIGPLVTIMTALDWRPTVRGFSLATGALSAVTRGIVGALGGLILAGPISELFDSFCGAAIGTAAGLVGGWLLGRLLTRWNVSSGGG